MSKPSVFRIEIRKEALKFSAAHMTVFPDGTKENLHGHNYRSVISLEVADAGLKSMIPFSEVKSAVRALCEDWDEKVLIAKDCPFMKNLKATGAELSFTLCGKKYLFPQDEVELLPLENITTELLAREFSERLRRQLGKKKWFAQVTRLKVQIEEMLGQGSAYIWRRG